MEFDSSKVGLLIKKVSRLKLTDFGEKLQPFFAEIAVNAIIFMPKHS